MTDRATPETALQRRSGSQKRQRSQTIKAHVTAAQKAAFEAEAAEAGVAPASLAYARLLGPGAVTIRATRRPRVEMEALARALGLLGLYGSNVNQLAREANAQGRLPSEAALQEMAREVRGIRDEIMQAMGKRPG